MKRSSNGKSADYSSMLATELPPIFIRPLLQNQVRFLVTGSMASMVYGEPRMTHDLDLVVFLSDVQIRRLPEWFGPPDFYCPTVDIIAVEAARPQRGHVNLIHVPSGFKADLYFAGRDPLHAWAFRNARVLPMNGESVPVAPPEYVIIRKLEYFREGGSEKHLRDIRLMLKVSRENIDVPEIMRFVADLGLEKAWSKATQAED